MASKKIVYLTIDDSPSQSFLPKVQYLKEKNIPAIFFCRGDHLIDGMDAVVEAIKMGFVMGNHAYNHKRFSTLTLEQIRKEIADTEELLEQAYNKAGVQRPAKLFRFPYGNSGKEEDFEAIQNILKEFEFVQPKFPGVTYNFFTPFTKRADIFWTYNIFEYNFESIEEIQQRLETPAMNFCRAVPRPGGTLSNQESAEVLLLHDHKRSKHLFNGVIDALLEHDLSFKLPNLSLQEMPHQEEHS